MAKRNRKKTKTKIKLKRKRQPVLTLAEAPVEIPDDEIAPVAVDVMEGRP